MANQRITDVDSVTSLNDVKSFFINNDNTIKQINRADIIFGFTNGGTGSNNGATGLKNLFAAGATVLSSHQYGVELPKTGVPGQLFFLKLNE